MFSPDDPSAFPPMCGHPPTLTGPEEDDAPDPPVDTPSAESESALNILQWEIQSTKVVVIYSYIIFIDIDNLISWEEMSNQFSD